MKCARCNKPRVENSKYCEEHLKIARMKTKKKKSQKVEWTRGRENIFIIGGICFLLGFLMLIAAPIVNLSAPTKWFTDPRTGEVYTWYSIGPWGKSPWFREMLPLTVFLGCSGFILLIVGSAMMLLKPKVAIIIAITIACIGLMYIVFNYLGF